MDTLLTISQEQEAIYNLLLTLQAELLSRMKEGAVSRDIYSYASTYVKEKMPELEKHFVKNVGFGVREPNCAYRLVFIGLP